MPHKLTATTVVLVALALGTAGCGNDDKSSTSAAQNAATTPAVTTTTTPTTGSKTSKTTGSKVSEATDAQTPSKTKTSGSKTKSTTTPKASTTAKQKTTTTKPKVTTKKPPVPAVTPKSSGSDLTSGTGSGPIADREDIVTVLRRYYKGFIDKDGAVVCSLLTSEGRKTMIADGNGKNCEDSVKKLIAAASSENIALLQRTRDGLHADDIKVTGNNATAQIGKTSSLRLVQEDGRWLLRSPDVVVSKS